MIESSPPIIQAGNQHFFVIHLDSERVNDVDSNYCALLQSPFFIDEFRFDVRKLVGEKSFSCNDVENAVDIPAIDRAWLRQDLKLCILHQKKFAARQNWYRTSPSAFEGLRFELGAYPADAIEQLADHDIHQFLATIKLRLSSLLQCHDHVLWSHIVYDDALSAFLWEFLLYVRRPYDAREDVVRYMLRFPHEDSSSVDKLSYMTLQTRLSERDQLLTELLQYDYFRKCLMFNSSSCVMLGPLFRLVLSLLERIVSSTSFSSEVAHREFFGLFLSKHGGSEPLLKLFGQLCSLMPGNIFYSTLERLVQRCIEFPLLLTPFISDLAAGILQYRQQLKRTTNEALLFNTFNNLVHIGATCSGLANALSGFNGCRFVCGTNQQVSLAWNALILRCLAVDTDDLPSKSETLLTHGQKCRSVLTQVLKSADEKTQQFLVSLCLLTEELQKTYLLCLDLMNAIQSSSSWWVRIALTRFRRLALSSLVRLLVLPWNWGGTNTVMQYPVDVLSEWIVWFRSAASSYGAYTDTVSEDFWRSGILETSREWAKNNVVSEDYARYLQELLCPDESARLFEKQQPSVLESSFRSQKLPWFDVAPVLKQEKTQSENSQNLQEQEALDRIHEILAGTKCVKEQDLLCCLRMYDLNVEKVLDLIFSGAFPVAEHSLSDAFNSLTKFFGKKEDETSIKQRTLALVKRQQEHEVREAMREGAVIDMDNQFRHNLAGVFTFESSSDEESDDALFRRHYDERHNQNKSQLRFGSTHDDETDDDVADTLLFDPTGTHEENLGPFRKDDVDDTFTPVAQRESNDQEKKANKSLKPRSKNAPKDVNARRRPVNHHQRDRRDAKLNKGMLSPFNFE